MRPWVAWLTAALVMSGCHRHAKPEPSQPPYAESPESSPSLVPVSTAASAEPPVAAPPQPRAGLARQATAAERAAIAELL